MGVLKDVTLFVERLYRQCLRRPPDSEGRRHFTRLLTEEGWSFERVASAIMASPEYLAVNAVSSPERRAPVTLPRLCFLHIEKTAGTSFHDYLLEIYPPEDLFPERLHRLTDYADTEFERYRLYSGHYHYGFCDRMPADTRFITFFRQPHDRILSLYYFWRSVRADDVVEQVRVAQRCGLAEFLSSPAVTPSTNNVQLDRILDFHQPRTASAGCAAVDLLEHAGIVELYSLSVLILASKFGWPLPSRVYHRLSAKELKNHPNHRSVTRETITPEIRQLLSALTFGEQPVYDHAVHRLAAEFRDMFGVEIPEHELPCSCHSQNQDRDAAAAAPPRLT